MMAKARRYARTARRLAYLLRELLTDLIRPSYQMPSGGLAGHLGLPVNPPVRLTEDERQTLERLAPAYLRHHFSYLGSGWRDHATAEPLRVNRANRRRSAQIKQFIDQDYQPIDWHRDIRTGYRFPSDRWARAIQPGRRPGVDIKNPWELTRMQHLPQLALLASDGATQAAERERYTREIRNQILDFIAHNPPRFGVNWRVPMDIAIRAANWVLALQLLGDQAIPRQFAQVVAANLRDHGRAIIAELEWSPRVRGNHYLADICGLVFIAVALPGDAEADDWLVFAAREVLTEGLRQIHPDGSGIEASTSYHRLSLEMLVHAVAVLLGLPGNRLQAIATRPLSSLRLPPGLKPKPWVYNDNLVDGGSSMVPDELVRRIWRAAEFTRHVSRPNGRALLIGDNDSGRFFKPCPSLEILDWADARQRFHDWRAVSPPDFMPDCAREVGEDHRHLVEAIAALFEPTATGVHGRIVQRLTAGRRFRILDTPAADVRVETAPPDPPPTAKTLKIPLPASLDPGQVRLARYPGWGLYLLRGPGLLLSFRCGPLGLGNTGNHDHNDQLAITLHLDGKDLINDPGSYRYTARPEERRLYRSVRAHFAPQPRQGNQEPGSLDLGPWMLGDQAQAQLECVGNNLLQGRHQGFGAQVHRRVSISQGEIHITDWSDGDLELMPPGELFDQLDDDGCLVPFCPDYGLRRA